MAHAFQRSRFHRIQDALFDERSPAFCYGLAALLAIAFIAYLFPPAFLAGHGAFFENGDASQHVAGWQFYARDAWRFPLLHTERLNHPQGTSIAFTDSIPLAALLFKAMAAWLPAGFHYIGLWHVLAFVTQALAAVFLVRTLGARHALAAGCAAFFALTWPALLWRIGHTSLLTQGIILAAFAIYFLGRQGQWRADAAAGALIALSVVALAVHPYFFAFCYPVLLAFLVEQAWGSEGWMRQLVRLVVSVVAILAVGFVLGYFGHGGTTTFGYGYYSTNLLTPFCGGKLVACAQETLQHQFGAYQVADATGGQYEGYTYLGAGVLLLMPFALVAGARDLAVSFKRHPVLIAALVGFAVYAVSNVAYFGAQQLWSFPLPALFEKITGTFRSGGRFFWPVAYLLMFGALAALLRIRSVVVAVLMVLALCLQWVDTGLLRNRLISIASAPSSGDLQKWENVLAQVDKVNIYPAFGCADVDPRVYQFFQRVAAEHGKLVDTGYIARPNVDCAANRRAFDNAFAARKLYIMPADYANNPFIVPAGFRQASERGECVTWRAAVACKAGAVPGDWHGLDAKPLAPLKAFGDWPASALPTQIGRLQDDRLVPAAPDKPGFLSYGPYIVLPPGRYHYAIAYASQAGATQEAGRWDIVLNGGREIASGALRGTGGAIERIEGEFDTDGAKLPLEIRTYFPGHRDLQLVGIALRKISQ